MVEINTNEDLKDLNNDEFQPLNPKDLRLRYGVLFFYWVVIIVLFILIIINDLLPYSEQTNQIIYLASGFILLGLLIFDLIRVNKVFQNQGYILEPSNITFRDGWLLLRIISVPFGRVQHVELLQPFLDKSLGLGRIKIYTAGGSSSDLAIRGLTYETAARMKNYILKQVVELTDGEEE